MWHLTCTESFPLNQQKENSRGESDAITFKNLADTDVRIMCLECSFSIDVLIYQHFSTERSLCRHSEKKHTLSARMRATRFARIFGLRCSECLCRDWESEASEEVTVHERILTHAPAT